MNQRHSRPHLEPEGTTDPVSHGDPESRRRRVIPAIVLAVAACVIFTLLSDGCRHFAREENVPLAAFPGRISQAPQVRMVVKKSAASVQFELRGPFKLYDEQGREIPHSSKKLASVSMSYNGRQLMLGRQPLAPNGRSLTRIRFSPEDLGSLKIDGSVYPGDVEFIGVKGKSALHVVVHLNIENYVCGVLDGEVPVDRWHDEALKAQAVASRTYAMYFMLKNSGQMWDFGRTGREAQQYKPGVVRNARINRAVNLTSGEILTWENMVFPAYFHSSCGGHTLDSAKVFTRKSIEPLRGVPCTWCTESDVGNSYADWKSSYTINTIAARLQRGARNDVHLKAAVKLGSIRSVEVAEKTEDGRITYFLVRGHKSPGKALVLANNFRLAMGASDLRSTKCEMKHSGGRYQFHGAGWGHGVGLCQWGSQGMARDGYRSEDILDHYYPYSRQVKMVYSEPEPVAADETVPAAPGRPVRPDPDADRPKG